MNVCEQLFAVGGASRLNLWRRSSVAKWCLWSSIVSASWDVPRHPPRLHLEQRGGKMHIDFLCHNHVLKRRTHKAHICETPGRNPSLGPQTEASSQIGCRLVAHCWTSPDAENADLSPPDSGFGRSQMSRTKKENVGTKNVFQLGITKKISTNQRLNNASWCKRFEFSFPKWRVCESPSSSTSELILVLQTNAPWGAFWSSKPPWNYW